MPRLLAAKWSFAAARRRVHRLLGTAQGALFDEASRVLDMAALERVLLLD